MDRVHYSVEKVGLKPHTVEAQAVQDKLTVGDIVGVEIYQERSNKFANKVEVTFQRVARAKGMTVRNVRGWIAAMTGRADIVEIGGNKIAVAWGTGPRDMSADEFQAFWEDAKQVIRADILPTISDRYAREDIEEMLKETR